MSIHEVGPDTNNSSSKSPDQKFTVYGEWKVTKRNVYTNEILYLEEKTNVVTKVGKRELLGLLFGLAASSFGFLAAGASATAATVDNSQLVYEHILNGTRKTLTRTDAAPLTISDVTDDVTTIMGVTYHKKITLRASFLAGDANNNHLFQEYAIVNLAACPGSPGGVSGVILNRLVADNPTLKTVSDQLDADIVLRI